MKEKPLLTLSVCSAHLLLLAFLWQTSTTTPVSIKTHVLRAQVIQLQPKQAEKAAEAEPQIPLELLPEPVLESIIEPEVMVVPDPIAPEPEEPPEPETEPKPTPKKENSPKPKKTATPTKTAPKKPKESSKAKKSAEKKNAPKAEPQKEKRSERSETWKKEVAELLKESAGSTSSAIAQVSKSIPQMTMVESEVAYTDLLISYLQALITLPEYGEVTLRLKVAKEGTVLSLEILHTQSSKNRSYLEKKLPALKLPTLTTSLGKEHTFTLTLKNF